MQTRPSSAPPIVKQKHPPLLSRPRVGKKKKTRQTANKGETNRISSRDSSTSSDEDSTFKSDSNAIDDERTLIIKESGDELKKPVGSEKGL